MLLVLFKKFLGRSQSDRLAQENILTPEECVEKIQAGDLIQRNQLITNYQPYIAKVTSKVCKRYIDPSMDDEFSIALGAFNEAINQYSSEKGKSFLSFAETVIHRRLVDYFRKEQRHTQQVPFSSFDKEDEEESVSNPIEVHQAMEEYTKQQSSEERRNEIIDLDQSLKRFGIRFTDLVEMSPKHADSRASLYSIGKTLSEVPNLIHALLHKKTLPIKELLEYVTVSRKTLERNRKFIIAVAIIFHGPYPHLKEYLQISELPDKKGVESSE